ncbi:MULTISPECIES: DNA methyltransferase [unclassified Ochrobactrum]|uniref:DNA methyltransferase n=1 Tax=unclassified Ochrobactrum TaxID=239106 RepID=UPI00336BC2E4
MDFILTDPPYLVNYRDRGGRTVANYDNARWLKPAFNQMHRVLKDGGFAVSFYGWNKVDLFMDAWKAAGFRVVGHIVFRKQYMRHRRSSCAMSTSRLICWRRAMFPCPLTLCRT